MTDENYSRIRTGITLLLLIGFLTSLTMSARHECLPDGHVCPTLDKEKLELEKDKLASVVAVSSDSTSLERALLIELDSWRERSNWANQYVDQRRDVIDRLESIRNQKKREEQEAQKLAIQKLQAEAEIVKAEAYRLEVKTQLATVDTKWAAMELDKQKEILQSLESLKELREELVKFQVENPDLYKPLTLPSGCGGKNGAKSMRELLDKEADYFDRMRGAR